MRFFKKSCMDSYSPNQRELYARAIGFHPELARLEELPFFEFEERALAVIGASKHELYAVSHRVWEYLPEGSLPLGFSRLAERDIATLLGLCGWWFRMTALLSNGSTLRNVFSSTLHFATMVGNINSVEFFDHVKQKLGAFYATEAAKFITELPDDVDPLIAVDWCPALCPTMPDLTFAEVVKFSKGNIPLEYAIAAYSAS